MQVNKSLYVINNQAYTLFKRAKMNVTNVTM